MVVVWVEDPWWFIWSQVFCGTTVVESLQQIESTTVTGLLYCNIIKSLTHKVQMLLILWVLDGIINLNSMGTRWTLKDRDIYDDTKFSSI